MPEKIVHAQSGAIEMVATKEEAESKKKFKGKKAQELTDAEVKELVFKLARLHHLV